MDMDESMAYGHVETFLTLYLETWAVASGNQHETKEMDGGGEEDSQKDHDNTDNGIGPKIARASNDHGEDSSTLVPKTSAVASKS